MQLKLNKVTIKDAAVKYKAIGLHPIPVAKTKIPVGLVSWKGDIDINLFDSSHGVALACGTDYGGLNVIDFDRKIDNIEDIFRDYCTHELVDRLISENKIIISETQNGGFHLIYRTTKRDKNRKFAQIEVDKKPVTIIESRSDGGYFVVYPTPGYKFLVNGLSKLNNEPVTESEHNALCSLAMTYNSYVNPSKSDFKADFRPDDTKVSSRYLQDKESENEAKNALLDAGWKISGRYAVRPGKNMSDGFSATFGYIAPGVLYVFSSNAHPFEEGHAYNPFQIVALLNYGGDFKAFAKELHSRYDEPVILDVNEPRVINEMESKLMAARIDPKVEYEAPPTVISVMQGQTEIPVLSLGDFSVLTGASKSKKTFFLSSVAASMVYRGIYQDKLKSHVHGDKRRVVVFDNEQAAHTAVKTARRIYYSADKSNYFEYFALRSMDYKERKDLIEYYIKSNSDQLALVMLDGLVDIVKDFNDLEESQMLMQWLLSLTKDHMVHIMGVLHQNKGTNQLRGFVGSLAQNKAESVIELRKCESDHSVSYIKALDVRNKEFNEFCIRVNADGSSTLMDTDKTIRKSIF